MDLLTGIYPLRITLDYARAENLLLGEAVYRKDARLWLHEDLAAVTALAAVICHKRSGLYFRLYDGFRSMEAQGLMLETRRVKDNPQWLEEPRLLSPPGAGGHPRAMAIDIALENEREELIDMGTPFDYLAENPHPDHNPAHREYKGHSVKIMENRAILTDAMMEAARRLNLPLLPLPQEWWDFRFPPEKYEQYAPMRDADLPEGMQVTATKSQSGTIFDPAKAQQAAETLRARIEPFITPS